MPQHRQECTVQHFLYYKSLSPIPLICDSSVMHIPSAEIAQKALCTYTSYLTRDYRILGYKSLQYDNNQTHGQNPDSCQKKNT